MWGTSDAPPNLPPGGQPLAEVGAQLLYELLRMLQSRPDESRLMRRLVRAKERVRAIESQLTYLASALGICPTCFGSSPGCPACGGQGTSGQLTIDPGAFSQFVAPMLERRPDLLELIHHGRGNGSDSHPGEQPDGGIHTRPRTAAAGPVNGDSLRGNGIHERNGGFHG